MSQISTLKALCIVCSCVVLSLQVLAQGCPPNIDFETGTYANWKFYTGKCCPINLPTLSGPIVGIHELTSGSGVDPYGGFPVVAPEGGKYSLKLGNSTSGGSAEGAIYYIRVPATTPKYLVVFKYAVVLQDPNHLANEQPRFEVQAYDSASGNIITCANFTFVASSSLPGFTKAPGSPEVYYKPWSSASIDLTAYKGQTVALHFSTGDCALGAHFGYAYVDIECGVYNTDNFSCNGLPFITLKAPPGFQVYDWRNASMTTSIGNTETITIPTPTQTTTYNVIVSPYSGYGCPDTIPVKVTISNMKLQLTKDTLACNGSDMPLEVTAWNSTAKPFTYKWAPATGLSCTDCPNPIANWQVPLTYAVTVTDTNGCIGTDTMTVDRIKTVSALIKKTADTVCQYAHTVLKDIATNPATVVHFWNPDTNGHIYSGNGSNTVTVWWGTPGLRRIIVRTSDKYCNVWDTAYIYVKPGPYAFFDMKRDVCLNEEIILTPAKQDAWYYWSIDGHTITGNDYQSPIVISYNTLGRKHVGLTVKGYNGCVPPPYDTIVTVHEFPVTGIHVLEKEICYGDTVTLNTIEQKRYIYAWTPVNTFVTNSESSVRAEIPQAQKVWLEVSNEWGCRTFDSAYVIPEHCCNVYFPDAFTPNGDGLNDRFRPISAGHHKIVNFIIANRWGKIIYESTDQYHGWDGTYKGVKQDYGMYFFYMRYVCSDGEIIDKKGSFLLIR